MGVVSKLCCPRCGIEPRTKTVFTCAGCGGVLEVNVKVGDLTRMDFDAMRQSRDQSIWRWFDFFPVADRSSIVSLGEGNTPLIHAKRLGERIQLPPE